MRTIRKLQPIRERAEYFEAIEAYLAEHFRAEIYVPLLRELGVEPSTIANSYSDLIQAIASGKIQYGRGGFEGEFTSALSKALKGLGAIWRKGAWKLPSSKLTPDMRAAIAASDAHFTQMAGRINKKLEALLPEQIAERMKLDKLFSSTIYKIDADFDHTVRSISIKPKLTDAQKAQIAKQYTENMKLYIQDWTKKEILKLREQVQDRSFAGSRYDGLVKIIQDSYGVSRNKAKFLARQETSLLMASYKETRYKDAGINEYEWRCVKGSALHPVRKMHKRLDGTTQLWSSPPIVDEKGSRKHPGQDYGCRCTAVPIVRF